MSTTTIDRPVTHSPEQKSSPAELPRAIGEHAVGGTQIEHEATHDKYEALRREAYVAKRDRVKFDQFTKEGKARSRLRTRRQFLEPLMELYRETAESKQPTDDLLDELTLDDPDTRQYCNNMLLYGMLLDGVRDFLDQERVIYQDPTDEEVARGVDLTIDGRAYNFKFRRNQKMYSSKLDAPQPADIQEVDLRSVHVDTAQYYITIPSKRYAQILRSGLRLDESPKATQQLPKSTSRTTQTQTSTPQKPTKAERQAAHRKRVAEQQAAAKVQKTAKRKTATTPAPAKSIKASKRYPVVLSATSTLQKGHIITSFSDRQRTDIDRATQPSGEFSRGESYASRIIGEVVGDNRKHVTIDEVARKIEMSIDKDEDTPDLIELKQLAANICRGRGITNKSAIELLDVLGGQYGIHANELKDFIVHVYKWSHTSDGITGSYILDADGGSMSNYLLGIMGVLKGFRLEASSAKLLRAAGYSVIYATREEDAQGIDLFVNGIPFDIKASRATIDVHIKRRSHATKSVKLIPPFTSEDFDGELVIPDKGVSQILSKPDFATMIDDAITQYIRLHPTEHTQTTVPVAEGSQVQSVEYGDNTPAELEVAKVALNATRLHRRRVQKAADAKWGSAA